MSTTWRKAQIVFGAFLLLSTLWLSSSSGWLNSFLEKKRFVEMWKTIPEDQSDMIGMVNKESGRKAVRNPAGKTKSLLNIKEGEAGVFRVSSEYSGNELAQFDAAAINGTPPEFPILCGLVGKTTLSKTFERVFTDGGAVSVRVGDQQVTEYSAKDLHVKVAITGKQEPVVDLRVEIHCKNSKCNTELSVYPGHGMVFKLPEPDVGWLVVYCGKDEDGAPSEVQGMKE